MSKVRPQRKNANRHTPRGMGLLEASIQRDGWIGAITVAADGETFDGSARVEVTGANGMLDDAIVVETDGSKPVVVVRRDIPSADDPRAKRLGIAANRVGQLNLEWEPGVLAELRDDPEVALGALFTPDEMVDVAMPREGDEGAPPSVDELWKGMPEFENEAEAARSLSVHFPTAEDCERFCRVLGIAITDKTKTVWYPSAPQHAKELFTNES